MPDAFCRICGTPAGSADRFCRKCGAALNGAGGAQDLPPQKTPTQKTTSLTRLLTTAIILTLSLSFLILVGMLVSTLLKPPAAASPLQVGMIGTSTLYPTATAYRTATPYRTATAYAPQYPYPTTGPLSTPAPVVESTAWYDAPYGPVQVPYTFNNGWAYSFSTGCQLNIMNQYPNLDALVLLVDVDTNEIIRAVYVRANDTFHGAGIETGTYYTFVSLGLDWDYAGGTFLYDAGLFRFKEAAVFDTCTGGMYGTYQYLDVTLNVEAGSGTDSVYVARSDFPSLVP